ncbi:MipA/OmpV family protein [Marinomonas agarivorans]|nr:MipA/OmpV family protein [Marinomonas agarivorans]
MPHIKPLFRYVTLDGWMNFLFQNSKFTVICITFLLTSVTAQADSSYSMGILGIHSSSIYKGVDSDSNVFPSISYDSDTFFFKELSFGYHVTEHFDVAIGHIDSHFDPDDSDNSDIKMLDEREGGFVAKAAVKFGIFSAEIKQDISGEHTGFSANAKIGVPLLFTDTFFLAGSIGYTYLSKKMSEHLYDVSAAESARVSGNISTHDSTSTSTRDFGLRLIMPLSKQATIITILSHKEYDDEAISSPLVEDDSSNSIIFIASYKF